MVRYGTMRHMDMREAIATELRARMAAQRIQGLDLMRESGVSRSTLSRHLKAERDLDVPTFLTYCATLGVDPGALIRAAQDRLAASPDDVAL